MLLNALRHVFGPLTILRALLQPIKQSYFPVTHFAQPALCYMIFVNGSRISCSRPPAGHCFVKSTTRYEKDHLIRIFMHTRPIWLDKRMWICLNWSKVWENWNLFWSLNLVEQKLEFCWKLRSGLFSLGPRHWENIYCWALSAKVINFVDCFSSFDNSRLQRSGFRFLSIITYLELNILHILPYQRVPLFEAQVWWIPIWVVIFVTIRLQIR